MIRLTRLNGQAFILNSEFIETIEHTPDTILVLTTSRRFIVRETSEEVVRRVIEYRQALLTGIPHIVERAGGPPVGPAPGAGEPSQGEAVS